MPQYEDRDGGDGDEEEGESEIPAMQKIGILFVALGQEIAGEVMKFLTDYEIEEITQAVASLGRISSKLIDSVLEDFEQHLLTGESLAQGDRTFPVRSLRVPSGRTRHRRSPRCRISLPIC